MAPKPIDVTIRGKDQTKPAFDSAEKNARGFAGRVTDAIVRPLDVVKGILSVQAVQWFAGFARASVESASAADAAMGRVAQSVTNAGISFNGVSGELDKLFTKIQETTRYSDDDAASAFSTLVTISGDYSGSLKNLTLAADIAAKKQIGIGDAAELVGKVMAGETGMLKRYGIIVKDGADAMQALRDKFSGFAQTDAATLEGRLHSVANAWDNVKEAVGRALTEQTGFSSQAGNLSTTLNNLGKWIDDNRASIADFAGAVETLVGWLGKLAKYTIGEHGVGGVLGGYAQLGALAGRMMGREDPTTAGAFEGSPEYWAALAAAGKHRPGSKTADEIAENQRKVAADRAERERVAADKAETKHIDDLKKEYDVIEKIGKLNGLKVSDYQKLAAIEAEMNRIARSSSFGSANRATAADFVVNEAERRRQEQERANSLSGLTISTVAGMRPGVTGSGFAPISTKGLAASALPITATQSSFARGVQTDLVERLGGEDAFKGIDTSLGSLSDRLKEFTGGTLANLFSTWQQGIDEVINQHQKMGVVIPRVLRRAAGQALAADAQDTFLRGAKALALGMTNPVNLVQAGKLFAVGTAELAAAAALSGGGSGGGGGYSGGSLSAGGFSQSQSESGGQGKVTVILKGNGINFSNPDELNALRDAMQSLNGTRELEFLFEGQS